jgi:hypothetical protein
MSRRMWSGAILLAAVSALIVTDAWGAERSEQLQLLGASPEGNWEAASAMSPAKGRKSIEVQVQACLGGKQDLVYAMPELEAVKENMQLPVTTDGKRAAIAATRLILGNAPVTGAPGKPVLPVVPCYIALPAGTDLAGVSVVTTDRAEVPGVHTVPHGQKAIALLPDAKPEYTPPDPAVYGSDDAWPGTTHDVVTVQKRRGVRIVVVNLNPVEYRPKSGRLSYCTGMKLTVSTKPEAKEGKIRYRPDPARPVSKQVDNPDVIATYEGTSAKGGAK